MKLYLNKKVNSEALQEEIQKKVIVLPPHIQMQNQVAEKNIHILTIGISQKANEMPEALVVQNL